MKKIFSFIFILVVSLSLCACGAQADPWLQDLEARAESGDTEAMRELAGYYVFPEEGRKPDYKKGIAWYEKASEGLNVEAINTLGWLYEEGVGVEQDMAKAEELYYKAWQIENGEYVSPEEAAPEQAMPEELDWDWDAIYRGEASEEEYAALHAWLNYHVERNEPECANTLADMYRSGFGVKQDAQKAIELYERSAALGCTMALTNLADTFRYGMGVEQDANKAIEYYEQAVEQGDAQAMASLGRMIYIAEGGVEQDKERGAELYRQAAMLDNLDGINYYANHLNVKGFSTDDTELCREALELYLRATELGDINAWAEAGDIYNSDNLGQYDYVRAEECYLKGAELGDATAMFQLCEMYLYGEGREPDRDIARDWMYKGFESAEKYEVGLQAFFFCENDDEFYYLCAKELHEKHNSSSEMAIAYLRGFYVERNEEEYLKYMALHFEHGNAEGALNIGEAYDLGVFTQDFEKAAQWYQKAAEAGSGEAMLKLGDYCFRGILGEFDMEKAAYWYLQALEKGNLAQQEEALSKLKQPQLAEYLPEQQAK